MLSVVMMNVNMPNVVTLSVVILSVVMLRADGPKIDFKKLNNFDIGSRKSLHESNLYI